MEYFTKKKLILPVLFIILASGKCLYLTEIEKIRETIEDRKEYKLITINEFRML